MFVQRLAGALTGTPAGIIIAPTDDEFYLANIPGPPDVGHNAWHRWWSGERSFVTVNASALTQWRDRLEPGDELTAQAGQTAPTKTTAINGRQTLTFAGATKMHADSMVLDSQRNTIYALVKPTSNASLHYLFGPGLTPASAPPTDDVLCLAYLAGVPKLISDSGGSTLVSCVGDFRTTHVIRASMSPEHGKGIKINDGDENVRNAALTSSLVELSFTMGGFGGSAGGRYTGDIETLLVLPGQDMSDPLFAAVDAEIIRILMARGGVA